MVFPKVFSCLSNEVMPPHPVPGLLGLERGSRCLSMGGRGLRPGSPPWCGCGRAGSGHEPPRRHTRCGGCSDTPWNSCGPQSQSGSGSDQAPRTNRSHSPGHTPGDTAPSRCRARQAGLSTGAQGGAAASPPRASLQPPLPGVPYQTR